jgi:uncharacterized membrane protein YdjX (TVP38/TMEM64 family)
MASATFKLDLSAGINNFGSYVYAAMFIIIIVIIVIIVCIPIACIMTLGTLSTIVFIGSITSVAGFTIGLTIVTEAGASPRVGRVAGRTLPAEVVRGLVT